MGYLAKGGEERKIDFFATSCQPWIIITLRHLREVEAVDWENSLYFRFGYLKSKLFI